MDFKWISSGFQADFFKDMPFEEPIRYDGHVLHDQDGAEIAGICRGDVGGIEERGDHGAFDSKESK